jgi:hypothetical protein
MQYVESEYYHGSSNRHFFNKHCMGGYMKKVLHKGRRHAQLVALVLLVHVASVSLFAQMRWMYRPATASLNFEYIAPSFVETHYSGFTGSTVSLSGRLPASEYLNVLLEVPYTHTAVTSPFFSALGTQSESRIGNPYVGVDVGGKKSSVFGEIGFRPSLTDENSFASISGLLSDIDRWEIYIPQATVVQGALNLATVNETGFVGRFRVGPSVWIPHKENATTNVLIDIGAGLGYRNESVGFGIQYTARMRTSQKDWGGNKDAFSHLAASISGTFGSVRPELYYKIPLDDEQKQVLRNLLGVSLSVELR